MADVIRRAIIEIETRQKKSRLEAPGADASTQGFKAEAEAAGKAEQATTKASEATKRHAEVVRSSAFTMVKDFREAGEGAFRMARGLTLLAASGSDDMKKLVQSVALAQGAFDVFRGGFKVVTSLSAVLGGPLAAGIAAVTTVLGVGVIAWQKWQGAAREALQETLDRQQRIREQIIGFNDVILGDDRRRRSGSQSRIEGTLSEATRERFIREELAKEREVGAKFARQAETKATGPEAIEATRNSAVLAEESLKRQVELTKELHSIERRREEDRQRELNQVLQSGFKLFGVKGFDLPDTSRQFDAATQEAERGIQSFVRQMQRFADIAEEMERRLNGAAYSK